MGPIITLLYTRGDGHREVKDWARGLTVTGLVPTGDRGVRVSIHIFSTVQERGCLPVQGTAAAEEDKDIHTTFFATVGTDREAVGIMHLWSSLKCTEKCSVSY